MTSILRSQRTGLALLAVASSASLFWFGNNLHPWWPLVWFAPLPVLLFAAESPNWKGAAGVAFAALFLGSFAMWHYFQVLGAPLGWVAVYTLVSTVFAGATLLFRARLRGGAPWSATLAFPAAMVSCEYALGFTPGGTAGSLANTQLDFLPFLQLASVTGPLGMTCVLLGFPAALAVAWHRRRVAPGQAGWVLAAGLGTVAVVLAFGVARLSSGGSPGPRVKVGMVASDARANVLPPAAGADTARLFQLYAQAAQKLASQGARIVVLPEKIGTVTDADLRETDALFQGLAEQERIRLVVGLIRVASTYRSNQARVYEPGLPVQSYDKQHLLPVFESSKMRPGDSLLLLSGINTKEGSAPGGEGASPRGIAICKDLDHTDLPRRYAREGGVGMLLVPAWDFGVDGWWHGHIAVMRGVENGCSIVRAAKEGTLYASDPYGRILGETRSDAAPFATLLVDVPGGHVSTLYSESGNWFAGVAIAVFLVTFGQLFQRKISSDPVG